MDWRAFRHLPPIVFLAAFVAVTFPFWCNAYLSPPDSAAYFAYARSIGKDADLDFYNDYQALSFRSHEAWLTDAGYVSNDWPVGTGVALLPPFLAAEVAARGFNAGGLHGRVYTQEDRGIRDPFPAPLTCGWDEPLLTPSGQSGIYKLVCALFVAVVGLVGLHLALKVAVPISSPGAAGAAAFVILLGTPVGFYFYAANLMAHIVSMFAVAAVLWAWHTTRGGRSLRQWAWIGALAGFMIMVRPQNVTFLVVFLIEYLERRPAKVQWPQEVKGIALATLASVYTFLPQLIVWGKLYGNPLQAPKLEEMHWLSPRIFEFLFSEYHGMLSWSPILILVPIGAWLLGRRDRVLALSMAVVILLQIYINAANEIWWGSGSFGARRMVNCALPFLVCLAAAFHRLPRALTIPAGVLTVGWNFLLWGKERAGELSLEHYVPWDGAFLAGTKSMLNPLHLLWGMLGDFAGFGLAVRVLIATLGLGGIAFAAWLRRRGSWHRVVVGLAVAGLGWIALMPPVFAVAASRTERHTPEDFPFAIPRRNISLFNSFMEYGYFLLEKHRYDESFAAYEKAADLIPSNPQPWRYLGTIELHGRHDPEQALVYTGKALDLVPDYDKALEVERAAIAQILERDPSRRDLWDRITKRLYAAGKADEARRIEDAMGKD